MEKYINDDTIVHDAIFEAFKEEVKCPICQNILINPMMCMGCQNVFCKKCTDEWAKKDDKCPSRCKNQNYQKSIEKKNILSKLKFKCFKCEENVAYDNIRTHMETCDKDYIENIKKNEEKDKDNNIHKNKIKPIPKEDVPKLLKGEKLPCITCK